MPLNNPGRDGRPVTTGWSRRLVVLIAASTVAALVGLLPANPAVAHGQLAMSVPARDSTVTEPLESLLLYFTEKPAPNAYFALTSPTGIRLDGTWSHAEPKRLDKPIQEYFVVNGTWEPRLYHTGFPVRVPVSYWPEQGLYTARYLSVASDGEEVRGEVRFSYTGATSTAPAGWAAPTSQPDPALTGTSERNVASATSGPPAAAPAGPDAGGNVTWIWVLPALLLIWAGVVVVRAGRRPQPSAAGAKTAGTKTVGTKTVGAKTVSAKAAATRSSRSKRR